MRDLERILYFELSSSWMPAKSPFSANGKILLEDKYRELQKNIPASHRQDGRGSHQGNFSAASKWTSCPKSSAKDEADPSLQKRIKFAKRLKCSNVPQRAATSEWMILDVIRFFRRSCAH